MKMHSAPLNKQAGVMLLEALISILIFSLGILAIVGLQAAAIGSASDAKYRTDASLLANELIGEMWSSDRTQATLQNRFSGINGAGGAGYLAWTAKICPASGTAALPGVCNVVGNMPTVAVSAVTQTVAPSNIVTITLFWQAPGAAPGTGSHQYTAVAQIIK